MANRNPDGKFITIPLGMQRYNLSRNNVVKLAKKANSLVKIGKMYRLDCSKTDDYLYRNST